MHFSVAEDIEIALIADIKIGKIDTSCQAAFQYSSLIIYKHTFC